MNDVAAVRKGPLLLLDAAGPLVQTGLWREGRWLAWKASREEAGKSIFAAVDAMQREGDLRWEDLDGFLFCEGPGSMLGIRIAAMAIGGWQALQPRNLPVFTYSSHLALARSLQAQGVTPPFYILSDARRDRWNLLPVTGEDAGPAIQRVERAALREFDAPVFRMEETIRAEPPVEAKVVPYDFSKHAAVFGTPGLLRERAAAEVLVQEASEYRKWTPERHR